MGKCVSKHPSLLTIALSEKDLTTANQIWSKFAESTEYIALKDEHGNQLCEYYYVSGKKQNAQPKAKSRRTKQQTEESTDEDNDPKTILFGATQSAKQNQHSNENQKQNPNQKYQHSQQKNKKKKYYKAVAKQSSTQQSNEIKSNEYITNTAKAINRNGIESDTEKLCQEGGFPSNEVKSAVDDAIATTAIVCTNVSGCEYCRIASITADDYEYDYCNEHDEDDDSLEDEQLFGRHQHYEYNVAAKAAVLFDNIHIASFDGHKNQQHCLTHLLLQPEKQNAGDTAAADANNNENIAQDKREDHRLQQQQLAAKEQAQLINVEVCKVNIGVKNAAVVDDGTGFSEKLSDGNYLAEVCSDAAEGQAESKKQSKKHGGTATNTTDTGVGIIETKGTAMSFGFRKKLNSTPKKFKKLLEAGVGGVTGGDAKKKQDKCNNITTATTAREGNTLGEDNLKPGTAIDDTGIGEMLMGEQQQDNNGNAELLAKVHFEKMGTAAATTQQSNQGTATAGGGQAANLPGVASRFGYRGPNIVRPASAGHTQRYQTDLQENAENNNNCGNSGNINRLAGVGANGQQKPLISNLKRRSKSAHAGRALTSGDETSESGSGNDAASRPKISQPKSITFNLSQNSTIEYQRRQFFEQPSTYGSYGSGRGSASSWTHQPVHQSIQHQSRNVITTGIHTNVIVRPTPRAPPASFSKFTLQTVSLPKPEFPVAISVGITTPTTPGIIYTPSPTMSAALMGARAKEIQPQHPLTAVASASVAHTAVGHMDLKTAKQMANNTRRGFSGSREISADSGIASMDMALDSSASSGGGCIAARTTSPKRSRSRPRNLQMVMNGRHKFEVRDLDDPLSSESSTIVEPLALPKLPSENQTAPLPLCGLVRSNTVLSRESYERNGGIVGTRSDASANQEEKQVDMGKTRPTTAPAQCIITRNSSEESEGVDEEKLYLDRSTSEKANRFKDINTFSSKTSSPGSSIILSWCNAGESLAVKDCSSLSISSEDSNKLQEEGNKDKDKDTDTEKDEKQQAMHMSVDLNDDDISSMATEIQDNTLSSFAEILPNAKNFPGRTAHIPLRNNICCLAITENQDVDKPDRPKSIYNTLNETKFAEMALAGSTYLLEDETSPTDSLVSSTESEEAASKQKKHKINEELQEKDIDEISPELDMGSPISPGTPTHASHSLSLSDCGNLIDDEIADQPALLFNSEAPDLVDSLASHKDKTDTPTLMENTGSMRSLKSQSKARTALQQAIELSLRTPLSLRKAVMERADSLDTLSPCESICSDDLMIDFDMHSSVDSIDRSVKSRSGSDLDKIGETELFSELERKGSDVMKELNTILRMHTSRSSEKDSVVAHLPARATRLLNRSRLQQQHYPSSNASGTSTNAGAGAAASGGGTDSDSSKSAHSLRRSAATSCASNASTSSTNASPSNQFQYQKRFQHHYSHLYRDTHSSSDDLMLYDKSFRNAMIQDVLQFKKQLLRLRRILQETDTLNPFDNDNGQLFAACGLDSKLLDEMDLASLASSITDDPMVELADLRRQVVYLQGEVHDRERTIRLQKTQIEDLESKKPAIKPDTTKECMNIATQTERTRPYSYGPEGLSRSNPEYTSYTTHYHSAASCSNNSICSSASNSYNNSLCTHHQQQQQQHNCNGSNNNLPVAATEAASQQIRRHTIISTTLSNYNQELALAPRRASIAWEKPTPTAPTTAAATLTQTPAAVGTTTHAPTANIYKPVKITLIGEPLKQWQWNAVGNGKTATATTTATAAAAISNGSDIGGKCEASVGNKNNKNSTSSNCSSGSMCNGRTNRLSKALSNGLCNGGEAAAAAGYSSSNGYTNGKGKNYDVKVMEGVGNGKHDGCDGAVGLRSNGQQNKLIYQPNQNHHMYNLHTQQALLHTGQQQQQTLTQHASKNPYQQQQKPQQVYQTPNGTNGNFNPTVTIV